MSPRCRESVANPLIDFSRTPLRMVESWESVANPLIDFPAPKGTRLMGWESVTRLLDRLHTWTLTLRTLLGISHQTP